MKQPNRRKGFQEQQKKGTPHSHCWESHQNTKIQSYNFPAEDLAQIHTGSMIVASFSVSSYEVLVDSVGHVLMGEIPVLQHTWNIGDDSVVMSSDSWHGLHLAQEQAPS